MIKKIVVALIALFFCALPPASAELMIEHGKLVISVAPGERVSGEIMVHNLSKNTETYRLYWEDFKYTAPYDGAKDFSPAGIMPGSAAEWVRITPQEVTLAGFAKEKIQYLINVPQDIKGGHYGVLFFEKTGDLLQDQTGVNIVMRTGVLFFIESQNKDKSCAMQDFKMNGAVVNGSFVNQGDAVLIADITYYAMDDGGSVKDRGSVKKVYVPPGEAAPFELALPADLGAGKYTFVLNADLEGGDVLVKEIEITKNASGSADITGVRD